MFDALKAYWKDEEGLTTVEYALLLALIVVVAITAWTQLGGTVCSMAETSADAIQ
ncbi:MAG: Flp family type IVb pilin [Armatimonadota bacterium]